MRAVRAGSRHPDVVGFRASTPENGNGVTGYDLTKKGLKLWPDVRVFGVVLVTGYDLTKKGLKRSYCGNTYLLNGCYRGRPDEKGIERVTSSLRRLRLSVTEDDLTKKGLKLVGVGWLVYDAPGYRGRPDEKGIET